jgi:hypothetical protein
MTIKRPDQLPTPDDVNDQHLASMGLAGVALGQPYQEQQKSAPSVDDRCPVTTTGDPTMRCARRAGHDGSHARGGVTWVAQQPLVEVFTLSCDDAKAQKGHEAHAYRVGEIDHYCPGHEPQAAQPTKTRPGDQPLPTVGRECIQDLVIEEMEESKRVGLERYGSVLMTFNGRKGIQDVAEEVRDLHVYVKTIQREAEADRETLLEVVTDRITQEYQRVAEEAVSDSPEGFSARFAEVAVDAIMGWVVGNTQAGQFADGEDVYQVLDEAWPPAGGRAQIIECQAHAVMDRLGITE